MLTASRSSRRVKWQHSSDCNVQDMGLEEIDCLPKQLQDFINLHQQESEEHVFN